MKLEVREAEAKDLPEIKRLVDTYISRDYYSMDALKGMLSGDRNLFYVVTDEDRAGAIVSYFYAFVAKLDEALKILHVAVRPDALHEYGDDTLVGVFKSSSTEREYRKHGVVSSFVQDLQPVVRERGAKLILATALHPSGQQEPMRHIFLASGFRPIAELYRPWSGVHSYCPYCRQEYCICDAVFYLRDLGEKEDEECNEQ